MAKYFKIRTERMAVADSFDRVGARLTTALGHTSAVIAGEIISAVLAKLVMEFLEKKFGLIGSLTTFLVLTVLISAAIIPTYYSARRDGSSWQWEKMRQLLRRRAGPDSRDYYTPQIEFQIRRRDKLFTKQFTPASGERREILMILKQVASLKRRDSGFELGSLQAQIREADAQIKAKNSRFGEPKTKLKWVCFVTKHSRFVAFQDYDVFRVRILQHNALEYVNILNTVDTEKYIEALDEHVDFYEEESKSVYAKPGDPLPDLSWTKLIPDLRKANLEEGISQEDAVRKLHSDTETVAMLVTKRDRKPVGVVSILELASNLLPVLPAAANKRAADRGASHSDASDAMSRDAELIGDETNSNESYDADGESDVEAAVGSRAPHDSTSEPSPMSAFDEKPTR